MKKFSGMYAAIPTPFAADGSIIRESFEKICERIIAAGMQGILVCGSTGEYSALTTEERKTAMKMVVDIVGGRCNTMASCAGHNQEETLEMVKYAESIGIDFALVVTPYYLTTTEEGIYRYYKAISDVIKGDMGLLLYNYPEVTTVKLSVEFIQKLAEIPHVAGIKDSDTLDHTSKLIGAMAGKEFGIVNGYEHLAIGTMVTGAAGTVGIIHGLCPEQMMAIYNAVQENDIKTAMEVNDKMRALYTLMEREPVPAPIKAAFNILGIPCGAPRLPLLPASNELEEELKVEMEKLGML
ncbi:4-hydroxy-tetrahydrodipicolinate synthase [Anaerotruncus rubiinfantis]|uniref:4-hydroxy-tetrahydrodipicolinate synthase n=1 Tax=Anaerotruncus rubiinfantis TaxID=1720200 RepID=UPI000829AC7C|nr:4-hydroxy-tetrahydrodipicolinate synthase [Anaerotruncus rubiinfantis]